MSVVLVLLFLPWLQECKRFDHSKQAFWKLAILLCPFQTVNPKIHHPPGTNFSIPANIAKKRWQYLQHKRKTQLQVNRITDSQPTLCPSNLFHTTAHHEVSSSLIRTSHYPLDPQKNKWNFQINVKASNWERREREREREWPTWLFSIKNIIGNSHKAARFWASYNWPCTFSHTHTSSIFQWWWWGRGGQCLLGIANTHFRKQNSSLFLSETPLQGS
jgi:hypothetical protein